MSASEDRTLKVWDVATGECVATLEGHSGDVRLRRPLYFFDDASFVVGPQRCRVSGRAAPRVWVQQDAPAMGGAEVLSYLGLTT